MGLIEYTNKWVAFAEAHAFFGAKIVDRQLIRLG